MTHSEFERAKSIKQDLNDLSAFSREIVFNKKDATIKVSVLVNGKSTITLTIDDKDDIEKIRLLAAEKHRLLRKEFESI